MNVKIEESMIPKIIGIVVAVIVACAVLIPIVDATTIKETKTQEEGNFTHYGTNTFGHEYEFDLTNRTVSYDGTDLGLDVANFFSDQFKIIWYGGSATLFDSNNSINYTLKTLTIENDGSYSYILSNDTALASETKLKWFVGPADNTGNYVGVRSTSGQSIYFNKDSEVYYSTNNALTNEEQQSISNTSFILNVNGTANDLNVDGYLRSGSEWVLALGHSELGYTDLGNGLYEYSTPTDTVYEIGGYSSTTNNTYIYLPYEYEVEVESVTNTLINIIPIFVVLGILIGIFGMFYQSRTKN